MVLVVVEERREDIVKEGGRWTWFRGTEVMVLEL